MTFEPLTIASEEGTIPLHTDPLELLCEEIYSGEGISEEQAVDLIFCSESTIQKLNFESRGKNQVTDVLSYPFGDKDYLGEIYICTARAQEQAEEYGFSLEEECSRLFVHGLIHLLGYDHMLDDERVLMEAKESQYLSFK